MQWLTQLFQGHGVASTVLVISMVVALGLAIGSIKIKNVSLGIAGVLFSGLLFGHFKEYFTINENHDVIEFCREFGLILFVYSVGMQVGPGFLASLRRDGLPLNMMAAGIVLIGAAITLLVSLVGGVPVEAAVGLFSGATTNTPSLAAAGAAIRDMLATSGATDDVRKTAEAMPGLGYAVAYPFGVLGIIIAMVLMRVLFKVDVPREEASLKASLQNGSKLTRANLRVTNPNLDGKAIREIPLLSGAAGSEERDGVPSSGIVVSRVLHNGHGTVTIPKPETAVRLGDTLLAVGTPTELDQLRLIVGQESEHDLRELPSKITTRRVLVTRGGALGKTLAELDFVHRFGAQVTRVSRADVEFTPTQGYALQYGDTVVVVGSEGAIADVSTELGNSTKAMSHPQMVPIFVGITLGVILGSWPVTVPGIPAPVKLGLAGGPLLVAIVLSRIGRVGPLIWHLPIAANFMMRELGITLFLACVGIKSGDRFLATLTQGPGLYWMGLAALITIAPLLIVALFARLYMKVNYLSICGLLSGSMTDPPALAFANTVCGSDAPSAAYATVYPLTMILRVVCAQMIVLMFFRVG